MVADVTLQLAKVGLIGGKVRAGWYRPQTGPLQNMGHTSAGRAAPVLDQAKQHYTACLAATTAHEAAGHPPVTRPHCTEW